MTRVVLEGVAKVYAGAMKAGQVKAVADFDLEIRDGELLTLIGPSGCGKTTLLRLIAGLERATAGVVRFGDQPMNDTPPHARNTAMVFQDEALQPHLDVRGNLEFGWKLRRRWFGGGDKQNSDQTRNSSPLTHGEITQKIQEAAAALGIGHLLARLPRQLSGGERQRVALGQAMVRSPDVLLLDEPLSNLDARLRGEMRVLVKRLHQRLGVATIYVTHDQVEAMALGDSLAMMADGKLLQIGPPLEVYDRPANRTVAELLGSPPMNFIEGMLRRDGGRLCFVGGGLNVELTDARSARLDGAHAGNIVGDIDHGIAMEVVMGIRPEHVVVQPAIGTPGNADSLANITMVETLGDSTILRLRIGKSDSDQANDSTCTLTAKLSGRWTAGHDQIVSLDIQGQHCHVFDRQSGANMEAET